ncbi:MAG: hypothetical protein AB8B59_14760 [Maribacter sp.]
MSTNKVKLLNNYQLFQLAENKLLDEETRARVHKEIVVRNISTIELKELKQRYDSSLDSVKAQLDENTWHPFYTGFAWKRHFRHIGLLKSHGRIKDAKDYQRNFYAGMVVYMLLGVVMIFLLRK